MTTISDNKTKSFYFENYGCQMNVADASEVKQALNDFGYKEIHNELADVVIINSCAVRGTAEDRVFSRLEHYHHLKKKNNFTLILMGCVAQKEKDSILANAPWVDLVVGTHYKNRLPQIIKQYITNSKPQVYSQWGEYNFQNSVPSTKYPFKADMTIIHGCNKFCTYCIVPYTRGTEISRPSYDIINNARNLVDVGITEIQLLGQNVNSYGQDNGDISFAQLLYELNKINGLKRIRFLTSHPKDFSGELIQAIKDCDKICKYVHLPIQSASNNVLSKMKREYTFEHYMNIINDLRKNVPQVVLSTDILVGFPYETQKDFEKTLKAVHDIRYDTAFMFKYSIRTGTESESYPDNIDEAEKKLRLQMIIDAQHKITREENNKSLNQIEEVLFESQSKKNPMELLGKTNGNKPVVVVADKKYIGQYHPVLLTSLNGNTFKGNIVDK